MQMFNQSRCFSGKNKIVIKNFKNIKDESPNIIDIDSITG